MPHPYLGIAAAAGAILLAVLELTTGLSKRLRTWVAVKTGRARVEYHDGHRVIVWGRKK